MAKAGRRCDWCGKSPDEMGDFWTTITNLKAVSFIKEDVVVCAQSEECHMGGVKLQETLTVNEWKDYVRKAAS